MLIAGSLLPLASARGKLASQSGSSISHDVVSVYFAFSQFAFLPSFQERSRLIGVDAYAFERVCIRVGGCVKERPNGSQTL